MCIYICVPHACRYLERPEEGIRFFETGVTDSDQLHVIALNRTWIFWTRIKTCALNHYTISPDPEVLWF